VLKNVAIVGLGRMGSALATIIGKNRDLESLALVSSDPEIVTNINQNRINPRFSWFSAPPNISKSYGNINDIPSNTDILFLALPSKYISDLFENWLKPNPKIIIVNTSKGVSQKDNDFFSRVVKQRFQLEIVTLSGPNFAEDIINNHETFVTTIAHPNKEILNKCESLFQNSNIKFYQTSDQIGTELLGSLKNLLAILLGLMKSLHATESAIASIFNISLLFVKDTLNKFHCNAETIYLPCGIGDIFLTCNSMKSRNYQFGYSLGTKLINNNSAENLQHNNNKILCEGKNNINTIINLLLQNNIEYLPFILLNKLILNQLTINEFQQQLNSYYLAS